MPTACCLEGGRVVGVRARVHAPAEARTGADAGLPLTVRAPVVVVAGGAIESPGAAAALGRAGAGAGPQPVPAPERRGRRGVRCAGRGVARPDAGRLFCGVRRPDRRRLRLPAGGGPPVSRLRGDRAAVGRRPGVPGAHERPAALRRHPGPDARSDAGAGGPRGPRRAGPALPARAREPPPAAAG